MGEKPQRFTLSLSVSKEDLDRLNALVFHASEDKKKLYSRSKVVRAVFSYADKNKEKINFE